MTKVLVTDIGVSSTSMNVELEDRIAVIQYRQYSFALRYDLITHYFTY